MLATNLAEALDVLRRVDHQSEQQLRAVVGPLTEGPIELLPMTDQLAWRAVEIRQRYYHRKRSAVSLADCSLLAVAAKGDAIVTGDRALLKVAEVEGLGTVPLHASGTRR